MTTLISISGLIYFLKGYVIYVITIMSEYVQTEGK